MCHGNNENMKKCTKCAEVKPLSEFPKDSSKKDGLYPACRSCKCGDAKAKRDRIPLEERKPELTCKRCKVRQPRDNFRKIDNASGKTWVTSHLCIKCEEDNEAHLEERRKRYYQQNREKRILKSSQWRNATDFKYHGKRKAMKDASIMYLGGKCEDCGLVHSDENVGGIYDFHHIDPTVKEFSISSRIIKDVKMSTPDTADEILADIESHLTKEFIAELDKCKLLCANCHRKLHAISNEEYFAMKSALAQSEV